MGDLNGAIRLFACISLIIGAVECFAGFKIMKAMMAVWGLFIGAVIGTAIGFAVGSTAVGVIFALVFGAALAILSYKLYLAGIFVFTAFLTAVAVFIMFENIFVAIPIAIGAGIAAVYFVKPTVIAITAISGAGIILSSAYLVMNLGMRGSPVIMFILWFPIALSGIAVQYITTKKTKRAGTGTSSLRSVNPPITFSERKYPGMQRAYRNFCIKCGCELFGTAGKCPRCGYIYDD